jgi:hypothetical protein
MKRIGLIKQTIVGIVKVSGDDVLTGELLEIIERKPHGRRPGFTGTCRVVLIESSAPLSIREAAMKSPAGIQVFWPATRIPPPRLMLSSAGW